MDLFYSVFKCFVFFSSRRRHTRCSRDWSSDVCSSDLPAQQCTHPRRRCTVALAGVASSHQMPQRAPFLQGTVPSSRSSRNPEAILKSSAFLPPTKIACRSLMDLRMFLMPVGMQLEGPSCLDNRKIVAGSAHKF